LIQATTTELAATGLESIFLKAVDLHFEGKNADSVVPIEITGTKDQLSFGLNLGGQSDKKAVPNSKK
jgi:hypothetical protein